MVTGDQNGGAEAGDETDPLTWARDHMPIHASLAAEYGKSEPFDGYTVAERKLDTLGASVDDPTERQREYDRDWRETDSGF